MRGEFIDLGGLRLYYYAAGTRGSGDPIVLLHGFPTSSHLWLDVVAKLPEGHRVIVVDLLGYGRSDGPLTAAYTVSAHSSRIVALLDQLKVERCCLVGHGTGGAIAARIAMDHPARVSSLALIGSSTREGWFARSRSSQALYDLALRLPAAMWMPILRGKIAGSYSDPARGMKSAEMYLARFLEGEGPRLLRRHLSDLTNGEIGEISERLPQLAVRVIASPRSPWRFMPEEEPSETAALIRAALKG
jgi:pimeloyl-ACP methyl ester carboxylesterase